MATPKSIRDYELLLNQTIANLIEEFAILTKTVENQLAQLIMSTGDSSELVQMRPQILAQFSVMDQFQSELPGALEDIRTQAVELQEIGSIDAADVAAFVALTTLFQNDIAQTIDQFRNSTVDLIVRNSVAGTPREDIVQQTRFQISGLMAESTNPSVVRLQNRLTQQQSQGEDTAETVALLQSELGSVPRSANLRETIARTTTAAVIGLSAAYLMSRSRRRQITRYQYTGGTDERSRDFCVEHDGNIYDEDEIYDIWMDDWAGKEPGDPFVVRGGYNCRHFWVPVTEEEEIEDGEET